MNFAEALDHVNNGCRMRCTIWGNERYLSRADDNSDLNSVETLDLEDVNSEWVHYTTDVVSKDLSFYQAMEYMDMKYKAARRSWDGKYYFRENIMYLQDGEELYDKESSCLSIDDVRANDWIAMK